MKKNWFFLVLFLTVWQGISAQKIIDVPWYSQKIDECDKWTWCGMTSALMVFDYYKQQKKTPQQVKDKLIEYIDNFYKVGYCSGILDYGQIKDLAQNYESFIDVTTDKKKNYGILREAIQNGFPVILNIHYTSTETGLVNGNVFHWIVLTGIDDEYVWINDPGTSKEANGKNKKHPIFKQSGNNSYLDGCWDGRYIIINPNNIINSGIEIHAGNANDAVGKRNVKITADVQNLPQNYIVKNFKIDGYDKDEQMKGTVKIHTYDRSKGVSFFVDFPHVDKNKLYTFSFNIADENGKDIPFFGRIYYIDKNEMADVVAEAWYAPYVKNGIENGLFKGGYVEHYRENMSSPLDNKYWFYPDNNLKRGEFAKTVVSAAINMGLEDRNGNEIAIDTDTRNGFFADVPANNAFFPYIQTLRNYGFIAKENTNFDPNRDITAGEMSKIIVNVFNLENIGVSCNQVNSKIRIQSSTDGDIRRSLELLTTIVDWHEDGTKYIHYEPLACGLFPIATYDISSDKIIVNGDNFVKRAIMAKALDNIRHYIYTNRASRLRSFNPHDLSNVTIIGDKFEATANVTGSAFTVGNLGDIVLEPGQSYVIDKFKNITGDIFFYWSVNGGTLEDLAPNKAHNMVKFTAPENITSTETYDLYMYAGDSKGRYAEAFGKITVEVNGIPNLTHLDAPTGLYVRDNSTYNFRLAWRAINGANKYEIQAATNASFTQNLQEEYRIGNDEEYNDEESNRIISADRGAYYLRVRAVNTAQGLYSEWSNTLIHNFDPNVPLWISREDLSPADDTQLASNSVTLSWTGKGGRSPLKYNLYFSDYNPYGSAPVLENSTATSYTVNNLKYNTDYYWGVTVTDADGKEAKIYPAFSFTTAKSTTPPTGSITINSGANSVNTTLVNLQLTAQATGGTITKMKLSNDGINWTDWVWYSNHYVWKLNEYGGTTTPGMKTVYAKFKDNSESESAVYIDNITLEQDAAGYFIVRDKQFVSFREANEYAVSGDNIYATAGYYDLSDEINGGKLGTLNVSCGATLKDGVNLVGEGAEKTTLYWAHTPQAGYSYGYYGLILNGNNVVEGVTLIVPATYATTPPESSPNGMGYAIGIRSSSDCTIKNCVIKNSYYAMYVQEVSNLTIQNCLIHDNSYNSPRSIGISDCNNIKFYNNTVHSNGGATLQIMGNCNNVQVKNNIVTNNGSAAIYIDAESITNLSFTNNNVWDNHYSNQPEMNYHDQSFALQDQTGINGNISADPRFDSNHKLLSNSPCINTGTNTGLPYAGNAPDMGAFETNMPAGSLSIQSNIAANFTVSKQDGSSVSVTNGQTLSDLEQGLYGIYPQEAAGYYTPQPIIVKVNSGNNSVQINYTADTQAPEGRIYLNAGDFFTHSRYISIYNDVSDEVNGLGTGAKMQFSNDGVTWSVQEPLSNKKLLWDLGSYGGNLNEGEKIVYAKFCDTKGNWSAAITNTIQYIPQGRIIVANPDNTYTGRTDGDIFLLKDGQYSFYKLGGSSVSQKIKIQGLNKNSIINAGTYYEPVKFDNVTIMGNMNLYGNRGTFTNVIINDGDFYLTLENNLLLANSVLTGQQNPNSYIVHVSSFEAILRCYNNVITGKGNGSLSESYIGGIRVNANKNNETTQIRNNIITDFMSDSYSGAIVVQRNNITYGDVEISNNNFYNNKVDLNSVQLLIENRQPYHFSPDFLTDGSYHLQPNSQLRNLGSDEIIHRNHDGSKNTLGIEGGLFYNTVPVANAVITQKAQQATLDASTSFDEQTPGEFLQYRWDYNNDGIFDTGFLLTPTHTVNINLLGDTIVGWVFDEHFSMNYVKVAKTDIYVLPDDANLSLSVEEGTYCSGSTIAAQPAVTGAFESDNLFAIELSGNGGTFDNPTALDYFSGSTISETQIDLAIPASAATGTYRLRLKSSNPVMYGTPSESFSVNSSVSPSVTISANGQDICAGVSVTFDASVQNAGSGESYQWYVNDLPAGSNLPVFSTNALQNGDVVKVELTCTGGCYFPSAVMSNEISMRVNSLQTPYVEIITFYYDNPQTGDPIDLVAYVENTGENPTYEWYVNDVLTGGADPFLTVNYNPNTVVKVKVQCNTGCLESNVAEAIYSFSETTGSNVVVTGISLDKTALTLTVGGTEQLTETVDPDNATSKAVTWSSDNMSVATVDDGLVTGVAAGTATITVTTNEGNKTATCAVTVNPGPSLSISTSSLNFVATGGAQTFDILSNVSWTVSSTESWATLSAASGSDNGTITVTATANSGSASRTARITVSGGNINRTVDVTQAGTPAPTPTLSVSTSSLDFVATGGAQTFDISSNVAWTVSSTESWATVSAALGSNNGTITVTATANNGSASRTARITVSGGNINRTVDVTQAGTPAPAPSLSVSPSSLNFARDGGSQHVNVAANLGWTAGSSVSWLTVSQQSGSLLRVTAAANDGYIRTGSITVTAGGITRTITVIQDAAQQIIVEPTMPVGGQGSIEVAFEVPVSEQFRISFTVTLPAGFILDEQATSLVSELQSSYRLSITPDGRGGWLFEVMPGTFLRSGNETAYRKIVNIVYTVSGTVQDGNYEVKIRDVNLILNSGATVHQDEISVPVTIDGASGNLGVEAVKILYYKGVLSVGTPAAERITVYAISGVPVYQAQKEAGVAVFNLTHLPRGIYIINGNSGWAKKVVVN